MSIRYEQVLPGQGEFFAYLAAPDIISRLDRGDLSGHYGGAFIFRGHDLIHTLHMESRDKGERSSLDAVKA